MLLPAAVCCHVRGTHLLHRRRLLTSTTPSPAVQMISLGRATAWRLGIVLLNTSVVGVTTPVPAAVSRCLVEPNLTRPHRSTPQPSTHTFTSVEVLSACAMQKPAGLPGNISIHLCTRCQHSQLGWPFSRQAQAGPQAKNPLSPCKM